MSELLNNLIAQFTRLPGVGSKTAQRYAYSIMNMTSESVTELVNAIVEVREKLGFCKVCGNYSEKDECEICATRDKSIICVVKEPKDINAIEKIRDFRGVYHVLNGVLNPLQGVGMADIRIKELLGRVSQASEIILALSPDIEGEATSMFISVMLKPYGVRVTKLSQGIPIGADIEYADENTLVKAFADRKEV